MSATNNCTLVVASLLSAKGSFFRYLTQNFHIRGSVSIRLRRRPLEPQPLNVEAPVLLSPLLVPFVMHSVNPLTLDSPVLDRETLGLKKTLSSYHIFGFEFCPFFFFGDFYSLKARILKVTCQKTRYTP